METALIILFISCTTDIIFINQAHFIEFIEFKPHHTNEKRMLTYTNRNIIYIRTKSRDSSVGIALGYGLEERGCWVRFPAPFKGGEFFILVKVTISF
jgi:hypothetical protein